MDKVKTLDAAIEILMDRKEFRIANLLGEVASEIETEMENEE